MQGEQPHHQQPQNHGIMDSGSRGGNYVFDGASLNIVLPPKPGSSNDDSNSNSSSSNNNNNNIKIQGGQARMDVCALTLSCLAQDPNLPGSKLPFAWKLYEMLETVRRMGVDTDIVSWVDDGTAFKVHDLKRFVEKIVPAYFKQSKYKSFQRQLYFYGFKRVGHTDKMGQTVGSYRHPRFLRGQKTLCLSMMPKKATKRSPAAKAAAAAANQTQTNSKGQQEASSSRNESTSSSTSSSTLSSAPQQQQQQQQQALCSVPDPSGGETIVPQTPALQTTSSDSTFRTSNTEKKKRVKRRGPRVTRPDPCPSDPMLSSPGFTNQQTQLLRLQMADFRRSIGQDFPAAESKEAAPIPPRDPPNRHPEPPPRSVPTAFDPVDHVYSVFGGKKFHAVNRRGR